MYMYKWSSSWQKCSRGVLDIHIYIFFFLGYGMNCTSCVMTDVYTCFSPISIVACIHVLFKFSVIQGSVIICNGNIKVKQAWIWVSLCWEQSYLYMCNVWTCSMIIPTLREWDARPHHTATTWCFRNSEKAPLKKKSFSLVTTFIILYRSSYDEYCR